MADLLECLLQIKGLRESVVRLTGLALGASGQTPREVEAVAKTASRLVEAERRWHAALALALPPATTGFAAITPSSCAGETPVADFERMRQTTVAGLDRCTAADLSASATVPGLGHVTVADIVAHMLASDTDHLGRLRVSLSTSA